jgi:hypothetical protein
VELKVDIQGLEATARNVLNLEKQVRFAAALALTRTAKEVQRAEIAHIRDVFTVRGSWLREGGRFGVGVVPATKDTLEAVVESRAPWLEDHEAGTTRAPKGSHFAIAQPDVRRTRTQLISRAQRPRALKKAFRIETKRGVPLLLQRIGRGARSAVRVMYQLTGRAKIERRMKFEEVGKAAAGRTWKRAFDDAIRQAIRTAR